MLSNRRTTRFVPVTIPEPMSIYETGRLLESLENITIPVKDIIVNRVMESGGCEFCRFIKEDQRKSLAEIEDKFSRYNLIKVPLFPVEIRGIDGLRRLTDYSSGESEPAEIEKGNQPDEVPETDLALRPDLEFILFGGKGGVGKTTLAAATALCTAKKYPGKRVLIFSTDPAHSLSDSFRLQIGNHITPIPYGSVVSGQEELGVRSRSAIPNPQSTISTNLFALEINADELFEDFKRDFKEDIEAMFDRFLGGRVDIKFDREVMTELLTLAPPGLDEIMALDMIMELRKEGKFDLFILDTSPTGHLLRFLELPEMVREWLRAFFRLLLKYKGVVSLATAAEKALEMSRNVRRIQETLTDREKTEFIGLTIPEAMGCLELERLTNSLDNAGIPCNHIAINMVIPETDCGFCSSKRTEQQKYIRKIRSKHAGRNVTSIPLFPHEVRGVDDLGRIYDSGGTGHE